MSPWHQLDPRVIALWRAQGVVRAFSLLPMIGGAAAGLSFAVNVQLGVGVGIGLFALALVWGLVWPSFSWRAFRYQLREDAFLVQRGVLVQHTVAIPRDRLQHADIRQGPIERLWGLSTLVVYTAAGLSADGSIPGLEEDDAEALRDALVSVKASEARADDGV